MRFTYYRQRNDHSRATGTVAIGGGCCGHIPVDDRAASMVLAAGDRTRKGSLHYERYFGSFASIEYAEAGRVTSPLRSPTGIQFANRTLVLPGVRRGRVQRYPLIGRSPADLQYRAQRHDACKLSDSAPVVHSKVSVRYASEASEGAFSGVQILIASGAAVV